jgi:hypothetical protein
MNGRPSNSITTEDLGNRCRLVRAEYLRELLPFQISVAVDVGGNLEGTQ